MFTVAIGSTRVVKYDACRQAFSRAFPHETFRFICEDVPSDVSKQPFGEETLIGAENRARNVLQRNASDFGVGLEGGIEKTEYGWFSRPWAVIIDKHTNKGIASASSWQLPKKLVDIMVEKNMELGDASDIFMREQESRDKNGIISFITKDIFSRTDVYRDMILLALAPFYHPQAYEEKKATVVALVTPTPQDTRKIYFAGSIAGGRQFASHYFKIVMFLKARGYTVLSEHIADPNMDGELNLPAHEISERDLKWLTESNLVVAEVTQPSLGVGFEIAYAVSRKTPVIALFQKNANTRLSPMIAGDRSQYIHLYEYTPDDLEPVLVKALQQFEK